MSVKMTKSESQLLMYTDLDATFNQFCKEFLSQYRSAEKVSLNPVYKIFNDVYAAIENERKKWGNE